MKMNAVRREGVGRITSLPLVQRNRGGILEGELAYNVRLTTAVIMIRCLTYPRIYLRAVMCYKQGGGEHLKRL